MSDDDHTTQTTRRRFNQSLSVGIATSTQASWLTFAAQPARAETVPATTMPVSLTVNGRIHDLTLDPCTTLLDALREQIGLTGTKKGCDHGQCGACTAIVDGRRMNTCLSLAVMHDESEITTIEGIGSADHLHPKSRAIPMAPISSRSPCTA